MILDWLYLLAGGLCEIGFVITMKLSDGFKKLKYSIYTVLFMAASFYSLSVALKTIPIGIGYGVWTGIGAIGSVIAGMILFKESKDIKKILFILMIVVGITGLRLSTH